MTVLPVKRCLRSLAVVLWIAGLLCGPLLAAEATPAASQAGTSQGCHAQGESLPAPAESDTGREACAVHCDAVAHALAAQAPPPAPPPLELAIPTGDAPAIGAFCPALGRAHDGVRGPPSRQRLYRKRSLLL